MLILSLTMRPGLIQRVSHFAGVVEFTSSDFLASPRDWLWRKT